MNRSKLLEKKEYPLNRRIQVEYRWKEEYEGLHAEVNQVEPYRKAWVDIVFRRRGGEVEWHYSWIGLSKKEFYAITSEPLRREIVEEGVQLFKERSRFIH